MLSRTHRSTRDRRTRHQDRCGCLSEELMTMTSSLPGPFLLLVLLLLSSTVSGFGSVVSKQYSYISDYYTWQEAQRYCRSSGRFIDLAVFHTQSDTDRMLMNYYFAWIGLYRGSGSSSVYDWRWTEGNYNLSLWANDEPGAGKDCAFTIGFSTNNRLYGSDCDHVFFFFCHELRNNKFHYTFVPQSKSWSEAQQYCRDNYGDLATFVNVSDFNSAVTMEDFPVWTGLHRDGETWTWSAGLSDYRNWPSDEPENDGDCVSISSLGKQMATQNCSARFPFVCFTNNLVLVEERKTWEEALEHCRGLDYELLSLHPEDNHEFVMYKVLEADTEEVWTGLRFLAGHWLWVNGASMQHPDLPLCPPEGQQCGALTKNDSVEFRDCSEKRNFLCYSTQ